jgi:signal transduction histidine kinase
MRSGLTLRAAAASTVLAAVVPAGFMILTLAIQNLRTVTLANTRAQSALTTSNELEKTVLNLQTGLRGYRLTVQPSFLRPFQAALAAYPPLARSLAQSAAGDPVARAHAAAIDRDIRDYAQHWAIPLLRLSRTDLLAARRLTATGRGERRLNAIRVQFGADLARETVALFAVMAEAKDIDLAAGGDPSVIVEGDRLRLGQLLGNLLSNAIKFTPKGGQVRVSVSREPGSCLIQVADTGIGIPADEREHLFERFYRTPTATGHGISGAGLGLAVCKTIAEAHEGTIGVTGTRGGGTAFVVQLPLATQEETRR